MAANRTPDAIVKRAQDTSQLFGFQAEVLVEYLTFDQAKPLLKPETQTDPNAPANWGDVKAQTDDQILADLRDYMAFAWGKVRDHRGISAGRSIEKMRAWLWLLGDDEALAFADADRNYPQYGAPVLAFICRRFNLPIPDGDDLANMIDGRPCEPGCQQGCGR